MFYLFTLKELELNSTERRLNNQLHWASYEVNVINRLACENKTSSNLT